jgi:hypothetical protein
MKKTSILLIAALLVPVTSIVVIPQVPANAAGCGINKTAIGVNFARDPNSYNDFTYTYNKSFCISNTLINGSSSTATPSNYKRASYALKILTSPTPAIGVPGLFRPFSYNATNTCTAAQNALGIKFSMTPVSNNPTAVTVKFCRGLVSNGIGDDARMQQTIKKTLVNSGLFPALTLNNVTVKRYNGTVI